MKRINIDGKWYVEESISTQDFDITYSYEASSGMFDFSVILTETEDGFNILKNTAVIKAYVNGRDKEPEYWDNENWLRKVRDGGDLEALEFLGVTRLAELENLLVTVSKKGWI